MRNPLLLFIFLVFAVDCYWFFAGGSTGIIIALATMLIGLIVTYAIIEYRKSRVI